MEIEVIVIKEFVLIFVLLPQTVAEPNSVAMDGVSILFQILLIAESAEKHALLVKLVSLAHAIKAAQMTLAIV
jgi:hypothetical protein